ncbi:PREDICTED: olfactory receptor 2AG2-like [Galeopterus variegatus]|uniref:Olfactory receptor 2AG2-like n=1 Tax=Galeopterus variegatus TaxID=482537 RepID=A0ABM0SJ64_GALVR|nr:PREDICTED: olfactory receptor 2AG2-like [Galeopterus variegatus]
MGQQTGKSSPGQGPSSLLAPGIQWPAAPGHHSGCPAPRAHVPPARAALLLLLAFMAYDRYVAICHPLNYTVLMRPRVCWIMVATSWILASLSALVYTVYTMHYPFCKAQKIRHLLCEIPPLLKLACDDTSRYELMVYATGVTFLLLPLSAIVASYTLILYTVLHMPSNEGRKKALVTCSSHLTVVGMFYGAATFMYVLPSSLHSPREDNIISVLYTIVTPALNPLIYSLRNKEVM